MNVLERKASFSLGEVLLLILGGGMIGFITSEIIGRFHL